jgi:hypothetical protein
MTSRSGKGFGVSPEKQQCNTCGRLVVAGPMGLSRHLARSRVCAEEYEAEFNPRCKQVLFPSMPLRSTVGGSSTVNDLLAFPSQNVPEDIPNQDIADDDDFP